MWTRGVRLVIAALILAGCGGGASEQSSVGVPSPGSTPNSASRVSANLTPTSATLTLVDAATIDATAELNGSEYVASIERNTDAEGSAIALRDSDTLAATFGDFTAIWILLPRPPSDGGLPTTVLTGTRFAGVPDGTEPVVYAVMQTDEDDGYPSLQAIPSVRDPATGTIELRLPREAFAPFSERYRARLFLGITTGEPVDVTSQASRDREASLTAERVSRHASTPVPSGFVKCPLPTECVEVSAFNPKREKINEKGEVRIGHWGIDLRAVEGTQVTHILGDGIVVGGSTASTDSRGRYVEIDSNLVPFGPSIRVRYYHLQSIAPELLDANEVVLGRPLGADGLIGLSGSSGGVPRHLHMEVYLPVANICKKVNGRSDILKCLPQRTRVDVFPMLTQRLEVETDTPLPASLTKGFSTRAWLVAYSSNQKVVYPDYEPPAKTGPVTKSSPRYLCFFTDSPQDLVTSATFSFQGPDSSICTEWKRKGVVDLAMQASVTSSLPNAAALYGTYLPDVSLEPSNPRQRLYGPPTTTQFAGQTLAPEIPAGPPGPGPSNGVSTCHDPLPEYSFFWTAPNIAVFPECRSSFTTDASTADWMSLDVVSMCRGHPQIDPYGGTMYMEAVTVHIARNPHHSYRRAHITASGRYVTTIVQAPAVLVLPPFKIGVGGGTSLATLTIPFSVSSDHRCPQVGSSWSATGDSPDWLEVDQHPEIGNGIRLRATPFSGRGGIRIGTVTVRAGGGQSTFRVVQGP